VKSLLNIMCNTILGIAKFKVMYTNSMVPTIFPIMSNNQIDMRWTVGHYICILNFELSNAECTAIVLWSNNYVGTWNRTETFQLPL